MSTVISEIIRERMERGLSDLLLTVADHFYCRGAGIASEAATHPGVAELLTTLEQRYQAEVAALRPRAELSRDAQIELLLTYPNQAESPDWLREQQELHTAPLRGVR